MSVKKRQRDETWYYRFNHLKVTYQEYGFQSCDEAKNAERDAIKRIQDGEKKPNTDARKLLLRDAAQTFYDEYACHLDNWATYRPRLKVIVQCFPNFRLSDLKRQDAAKLILYVKTNVTTKYRESDKIIDKPIGEHTARHYYSALKALINWWIHEKGLTIPNPFTRLKFDPIPKAKVRFLYPAEEQVLTPEIQKDIKLWPYYFTALETGLRANNLCHMKVKDMDAIIKRIFIPLSKNGRSGYIPISDRLLPFLVKLAEGKKPDDFLLGNYTRHTVSKKFKAAALAVGLTDVDFHTLRHTFAYNLLSQRNPIYIVSKLLLHREVRVTEDHYGHVALSDLSSVVNSSTGYISSLTPNLTPNHKDSARAMSKAVEDQQLGSVG